MDVTDALLGEHGVFYLLIEQLDDAVERLETVPELRAAAAPLAISLIAHARIEEDVIFGRLEKTIGLQGPLHCLQDDHNSMDQELRKLFSIADVASLKAAIKAILETARGHFAKEEQVLFPVARRTFDVERRKHLGEHWAKFRGITLAE